MGDEIKITEHFEHWMGKIPLFALKVWHKLFLVPSFVPDTSVEES